ncbi:flagellar export protein FliJ [Rhabdochromatium marinum]|uniref:flagellar export protein FliJ n=1 Tax=Rhabdochromatium marinum TaxID=48729 RepID=UPI001905D614|nr:flagellar export protein FliJ [Rhabdochromatium marinum]MBK1648902.1 flagellar export protein FliJ [Rhabdochromatium marinum]
MSVKRFQRLLKVREMIENQAAIGLAARLDELHRIEGQHGQLEDLLNSYLEVGVPNSARGMRQVAEMRSQLRTVIEQQELRIAEAEFRVEEARDIWMEKHRDSLSLEKLIERRRQVEEMTENRRMQSEQDAWATRQAFDRVQADQ